MEGAVECGERLALRAADGHGEQRVEKTRMCMVGRVRVDQSTPMDATPRLVEPHRLRSIIAVAKACGMGRDLYMDLVIAERPYPAAPQLGCAGELPADTHGALHLDVEVGASVVAPTDADETPVVHRRGELGDRRSCREEVAPGEHVVSGEVDGGMHGNAWSDHATILENAREPHPESAEKWEQVAGRTSVQEPSADDATQERGRVSAANAPPPRTPPEL
jgi:hypothetical protein